MTATTHTDDTTHGFTITCDCGHETSATFRDDAERAARDHEAQFGHIDMTTVEEDN